MYVPRTCGAIFEFPKTGSGFEYDDFPDASLELVNVYEWKQKKSYRTLEQISKNEEERVHTLLFDAPVLLEGNEEMKGISDHRD